MKLCVLEDKLVRINNHISSEKDIASNILILKELETIRTWDE